MHETWDQTLMGKRMKAAAIQAGLTETDIAPRLGTTPRTVSRWWAGENDPRGGTLLAYARLVGKPVDYFFEQEEEAQPREMAQWLLRWVQFMMAGEEPGAAFDRVTGTPQELTPRERQQLAAAAPRMREELRQAARGDWELLTEAQQRQVLEQMAQLAAPKRAAP